MNFLQIDEIDCSLCNTPHPFWKSVTLSCSHAYHARCLRKHLRASLNDPNCPVCQARVQPGIVSNLCQEVRKLSYSYTLPMSFSRDRTLSIQVIYQKEDGDENQEFMTDPLRVQDLPEDPKRPGQVFVKTDIDITLNDPDTVFRIWTEDVKSGNLLSPILRKKSVSEENETSSSNEEDELNYHVFANEEEIPTSSTEWRRRRTQERYLNSRKKNLRQLSKIVKRIKKHRQGLQRAEEDLERINALLKKKN